MKKINVIAIAVLASASFILNGCGSNVSQNDDDDDHHVISSHSNGMYHNYYRKNGVDHYFSSTPQPLAGTTYNSATNSYSGLVKGSQLGNGITSVKGGIGSGGGRSAAS